MEKISPMFSFSGWKFSEWLKGNWKGIKEVLKYIIAYLATTPLTGSNPVLLLALTQLLKSLLDIGEFYVKQKEL